MIQGGDITAGDGTGGLSIYGPTFADENLGWRPLDSPYLVCMANRGPDTNSSQFFITLDACEHLNGKHTVFGHVVGGKDVVDKLAQVKVDADDKPLQEIHISNSGELQRRKKPSAPPSQTASKTHSAHHSLSSSPDPDQRNKHRHHHRRHRSPLRDADEDVTGRRRVVADHTQRGRPMYTSRSPREEARKRSTSPSRPRSASPDYRRQRSLPNQYKRYNEGREVDQDEMEERRLREVEMERDRDRDRDRGNARAAAGRLGGFEDEDDGIEDSGIVYKGRGAMKFREKQRRW